MGDRFGGNSGEQISFPYFDPHAAVRYQLQMKKLLALILCVMLFVSVIPTAAFAATITVSAGGTTVVGSKSGWADKSVSKDAAKAARDAIEAMYTAIAVDQTVFNSAKAMYDFSDGLAKSLFANTESATNGTKTVYHDDLVANTRKFLNSIIGGAITTTLNEKAATYTSYNADGTVKGYDPAKYMKAYAEAASKALGSEKAQKGIEAVALALMAASVQSDMVDRLKDMAIDIADWGKWSEFGFSDPFDTPVMLQAAAPDLAKAGDISFLFS